MLRWIRNKWRRIMGHGVYEYPSRIVAMTQFRDMVVIACTDGTIWVAQPDERIGGLVFHKQADLR